MKKNLINKYVTLEGQRCNNSRGCFISEFINEKDEKFIPKILIVGEFSVGKSTFINSLIGKRILPSKNIDTTSIITNINNVSVTDPKCKSVKVHFDNGDVEAIDYSFDAVEKMVTHYSDKNKNVKSVDVFTNVLGNKPFQLIDTPGLNSGNELSEKILINLLNECSIPVFVCDPKGFNERVLSLLENVTSHFDNIIILLNKVDKIVEEEGESIASVKKNIENQLRIKKLDWSYTILEYTSNKEYSQQDQIRKKFLNHLIKRIDDRNSNSGWKYKLLERYCRHSLSLCRDEYELLDLEISLLLEKKDYEKKSISENIHFVTNQYSKITRSSFTSTKIHFPINEIVSLLEKEKQINLSKVDLSNINGYLKKCQIDIEKKIKKVMQDKFCRENSSFDAVSSFKLDSPKINILKYNNIDEDRALEIQIEMEEILSKIEKEKNSISDFEKSIQRENSDIRKANDQKKQLLYNLGNEPNPITKYKKKESSTFIFFTKTEMVPYKDYSNVYSYRNKRQIIINSHFTKTNSAKVRIKDHQDSINDAKVNLKKYYKENTSLETELDDLTFSNKLKKNNELKLYNKDAITSAFSLWNSNVIDFITESERKSKEIDKRNKNNKIFNVNNNISLIENQYNACENILTLELIDFYRNRKKLITSLTKDFKKLYDNISRSAC